MAPATAPADPAAPAARRSSCKVVQRVVQSVVQWAAQGWCDGVAGSQQFLKKKEEKRSDLHVCRRTARIPSYYRTPPPPYAEYNPAPCDSTTPARVCGLLSVCATSVDNTTNKQKTNKLTNKQTNMSGFLSWPLIIILFLISGCNFLPRMRTRVWSKHRILRYIQMEFCSGKTLRVGNFGIVFPPRNPAHFSALHHPTRYTTPHAPLCAHAYWMLIGTCDSDACLVLTRTYDQFTSAGPDPRRDRGGRDVAAAPADRRGPVRQLRHC